MREQSEQERDVAPSWLPYFTVEKVDDAIRRAEQMAAQRLVSVTEVHVGRFAVMADPQGAAFAVFEGRTDP
jgi:uncharacterized protein